MSDLEEQKGDWKLFYFPAIIILTGYVLYGKIENMLGKSTDANPFQYLDYFFYYLFVGSIFLTFGLGYIVYFKYLTKNQESKKNLKILYVGLLTLIISFIIYGLVEEWVGVSGSGSLWIPPIRIPNFMPWFVSYESYATEIVLSWYHIFIFFLFFPTICYGFIAMDHLHFRNKIRSLRMFIMFFGVNLLGLMWQDFYYFVSDPSDYLIPGERYGVYFNQWLGPIPTLYIVTNLLGLSIIWLAISVKSGIRFREIYRFLIFIGIILAIGVTVHTVKIPFIS
ncbi:MAG: hypothetical protein ACFFD2_30090 [Promethearchaeota archaeon]